MNFRNIQSGFFDFDRLMKKLVPIGHLLVQRNVQIAWEACRADQSCVDKKKLYNSSIGGKPINVVRKFKMPTLRNQTDDGINLPVLGLLSLKRFIGLQQEYLVMTSCVEQLLVRR